jgi:hypothetical protein
MQWDVGGLVWLADSSLSVAVSMQRKAGGSLSVAHSMQWDAGGLLWFACSFKWKSWHLI